jgi:Pyridine nucleotide-disulphide oxidoreductase
MTAEHGRKRGLDLAIELVTRESAPLGIFGAEASAAVAQRLEDAGVRLRTGTFAQEVADGKLWLELEGMLDVDLVIALPPLSGPHLAGLPDEFDGFVPVDHFGRVRGVDRVWAVGDMTTRPLKQGGLTAQQADVAAADIAHRSPASTSPCARTSRSCKACCLPAVTRSTWNAGRTRRRHRRPQTPSCGGRRTRSSAGTSARTWSPSHHPRARAVAGLACAPNTELADRAAVLIVRGGCESPRPPLSIDCRHEDSIRARRGSAGRQVDVSRLLRPRLRGFALQDHGAVNNTGGRAREGARRWPARAGARRSRPPAYPPPGGNAAPHGWCPECLSGTCAVFHHLTRGSRVASA